VNSLFAEEIRPHHSMRDLALSLLSDGDLDYRLPGWNPTLGELFVEMGAIQGVYTHSFETFDIEWDRRRLPPPPALTVAGLRAWFAQHDEAMEEALSRFTDAELHSPRIDRGSGFIVSPFTQHEIYREAVYIFYGKLSVYLRALERDAGPDWAAWVG
jgi:hypothetical protein